MFNKIKLYQKFFIFLAVVMFCALGAALFIYNFLVLKQRMLLLGIFLVLNVIFIIGMIGFRKTGTIVSTILLILVMLFELLGTLYLWRSMQALSRLSEPDPIEESSETASIQKAAVTDEPFNVFLSGIDTSGVLSAVSRSDVDMILTVNPRAKRILVTTIPRDSYMRIARGGKNQYDKLTHSGNYGVDSTRETLENFFDIKIPYYFRVNFDSLVQIVDIIGGITVDNPEAFVYPPNYKFPKGKIDLDGENALRFARERYGLKDGEMARGRNHVRIIEAMIQKMTSPSILLNYTNLLSLIEKQVQTNMPEKMMVNLINAQIADNSGWKIESQQLQGTSTMGYPSYAMPDSNLYMLIPSQESKRDIQAHMKAIKENQPYTVPEKTYESKDEDFEDIPSYHKNSGTQNGNEIDKKTPNSKNTNQSNNSNTVQPRSSAPSTGAGSGSKGSGSTSNSSGHGNTAENGAGNGDEGGEPAGKTASSEPAAPAQEISEVTPTPEPTIPTENVSE